MPPDFAYDLDRENSMMEEKPEDLYERIVRQMMEKGLTIALMESCTGGYLASLITDVEGASGIFYGSCVTYCNEEKIRQGVRVEVINTYGVYSEETARAMATACRTSYCTDIGIGVTGTLGRKDPHNRDSLRGEIFFAVDWEGNLRSQKLWVKNTENRRLAKVETAEAVGFLLERFLLD